MLVSEVDGDRLSSYGRPGSSAWLDRGLGSGPAMGSAAAAGDELGVIIIGASAAAAAAAATALIGRLSATSCSGSDPPLLPTTGRLRDVLSLGRGGGDPELHALLFICSLSQQRPY
mmetsp:Transcript_19561/g.56296  ORF Transcript_19561/g.56296 Transcript_19561/m.56296 type:complete len:116 (+) Transcript_19561:889-1236(+)